MASAGTAYVEVEAKLDSFASDVDAAVSAIDTQTITVEAEVDGAQSAIDSLEGESVNVAVDVDTSGAQEGLNDLSGSLDGLMGDLGGGIGGGVAGMMDGLAGSIAATGIAGGAAAAGGIGLLTVGVSDAVNSFGEAQVVAAETESMLASLGNAAFVSSDQVAQMSQRIMEYSGFSDEAVQQGANTLLMFDNISSAPVFERALDDSADLARRLRTDVPTAARMLGMALQDPEAGMNRLRRAGVVLNESQKATVEAMMETGDVAGAQEVIFAALEGKIGELAEAYGQTLPGQIDRTNEAIDESKESIGEKAAPWYVRAAQGIENVVAVLTGGANAARDTTTANEILGDGAEVTAEQIDQLPPALRDVVNAATGATTAQDDYAAAQERARQAVANTLPTLGGVISQVDAAGEAFGVLNASSDPQVVIDNLGLALFAWQDFQNNIAVIDDWGPRIAGALQQLGPDVAGGLTNALAEGGAATILELDNLLAQVEAKGGDISAVLTGFATNGMAGAVAAVGDAAPGMEGAGAEAGAAGAAGIADGLSVAETGEIGRTAGQNWGAGVISGIGDTAGAITAKALTIVSLPTAIVAAGGGGRIAGQNWGAGVVGGLRDAETAIDNKANSVVGDAGSTFTADQRGYQIGRAYAEGVERGMATAPEPRAAGGPVTSSNTYLVGEQGPELFVPRTSGTIIPAPQTAAMAGGRSANYTINVTAGGGTDGQELARLITDELRKLERAGQ